MEKLSKIANTETIKLLKDFKETKKQFIGCATKLKELAEKINSQPTQFTTKNISLNNLISTINRAIEESSLLEIKNIDTLICNCCGKNSPIEFLKEEDGKYICLFCLTEKSQEEYRKKYGKTYYKAFEEPDWGITQALSSSSPRLNLSGINLNGNLSIK